MLVVTFSGSKLPRKTDTQIYFDDAGIKVVWQKSYEGKLCDL